MDIDGPGFGEPPSTAGLHEAGETKKKISPGSLIQADAKKYAAVLSSLGLNKTDLRKIEKMKEIEVDRSGYSPQVAEVLGEDYLGSRIILTSPEQGDAKLVKEYYSFSKDLLDRMFSELNEPIQFFNGREYLCCDIVLGANDSHFKSRIKIETPTSAIERLKEIGREIEKLDEDDMLNDEKLRGIAKEATDLKKTYDDIKGATDALKGIEKFKMIKIGSFKINRSDGEAYFFAYGKPLCVYFGKKPKLEYVDFVNGKNRRKAVDALIETGMLKLDKTYAEEIMRKLEEETLKNAGVDAEEVNKMRKQNLFEYYRWMYKIAELPGDWYKLREMLDGTGTESKIDTSFKFRFYKPKKDEILSELMDRLG